MRTQNIDACVITTIYMNAYTHCAVQQQMAGQVMAKFRENPDAWTQVDYILEFSNNQYTKFFALQILEALIKTRWRALPREQCEGIHTCFDFVIVEPSIRSPFYQNTVHGTLHVTDVCKMAPMK